MARELGRAAQLPRTAGRRPALGGRVRRPQALATMLMLSSPSASETLALTIALQRLGEDIIRARARGADTRKLDAQDARIRDELARFGQQPPNIRCPLLLANGQASSRSSAPPLLMICAGNAEPGMSVKT